MPIVRITKAQIEKANKARKAALLKDPEFRVYDERQQFRREAASKQNEQIEDANKARKAAPSNDSDFRPCNERQRVEREGVAREMEQDS